MMLSSARAPILPAALAVALSLAGCSWYHAGGMAVSPEVTVSDTTAVPAEPDTIPPSVVSPDDGGAPRKIRKTPPVAARPAETAVPDSSALAPPEHPPTVTIRLSAEDRAARETQYREDVDRAVRSLTLVRGRALGKSDQEELSAADQFLADARRAFEAADLVRACTVAEKARVLAEELRARLAPP